MLRARVEPLEQRPRLWRYDRLLIALARERLYGGKRRKPHDGDEFDLRSGDATQHLDAPEAIDVSAHDSLKYFRPKQLLVGVGVLRGGPAMPDAADHDALLALLV